MIIWTRIGQLEYDWRGCYGRSRPESMERPMKFATIGIRI